MATGGPNWKDSAQSDSEMQSQTQSSAKAEEQEARRDDGDMLGQSSSLSRSAVPGHKPFLSGSLLQDNVHSPKKFIGDGDR